jgi:transcriptional regulator with XRE-family HTH domain
MAATAPVAATPVSTLGRLLRQWRQVRNLSQLELALATGISAKHLSFVETGRAQPGRDVVLRLASALDLPLRDRNAALMAAGYAPLYGQGRLDAPEMSSVARAVEFMLRHQEPFPVVVADRLSNVLRRNEATERLLRFLLDEPDGEAGCVNLYRLVLSPTGLRPLIVNWDEVARQVVMRVRRELSATPSGPEEHAFLAELLSLPGLPAECHTTTPEAAAPPVVPTIMRKDGRTLSLFHTITTLGTPQDVTLQELRIETSFPADAETEAFLRALHEGEPLTVTTVCEGTSRPGPR